MSLTCSQPPTHTHTALGTPQAFDEDEVFAHKLLNSLSAKTIGEQLLEGILCVMCLRQAAHRTIP